MYRQNTAPLTAGKWVLNLYSGPGFSSLARISCTGPNCAYYQIPGREYGKTSRGKKREPALWPWEIEITPWQATAFSAERERLFTSLGNPGWGSVNFKTYLDELYDLVYRVFGRRPVVADDLVLGPY